MAQQVKTALRYPAFVITAMVAAIGVINLMVVPAFANVFKQAVERRLCHAKSYEPYRRPLGR